MEYNPMKTVLPSSNCQPLASLYLPLLLLDASIYSIFPQFLGLPLLLFALLLSTLSFHSWFSIRIRITFINRCAEFLFSTLAVRSQGGPHFRSHPLHRTVWRIKSESASAKAISMLGRTSPLLVAGSWYCISSATKGHDNIRAGYHKIFVRMCQARPSSMRTLVIKCSSRASIYT